MSAVRSVKKNYVYNLIYQIFLILTPLITAPYLSRVLGASGLGTYGYVFTICSYFIIFADLGAATYGSREIAYVRDSPNKKTKVFWEIFILKLITTGISTAFYLLLCCFSNDYKNLYYILIINLVAGAFDITWFFYGIEDFKNIVLRNITLRAVGILSILLFVKTQNDLGVYALINASVTLLGNVILWPNIKKELAGKKKGRLKPFRHLKGVIVLFIPQIAIQIYTLLDKTMIGLIAPEMSEVGYYEQAQKIIKLLLVVVTTLGTVMSPRIAYMHSKRDESGISEYIIKSFRVMSLIAFPLMFGIIAISEPFAPFFFGEGFEPVGTLMSIISPIIVLIGMSNIIGVQYMLPTRKNKEYTISVIIGACVNVVINLILIPKYGAFGASIGTVAAEFCVTVSQMAMVRNDIKLKEVFLNCWKYFIVATVMFVACLVAKKLSEKLGGVMSMLVIVTVGCVSYASVLILTKDKAVVLAKNELRKIWRKK